MIEDEVVISIDISNFFIVDNDGTVIIYITNFLWREIDFSFVGYLCELMSINVEGIFSKISNEVFPDIDILSKGINDQHTSSSSRWANGPMYLLLEIFTFTNTELWTWLSLPIFTSLSTEFGPIQLASPISL